MYFCMQVSPPLPSPLPHTSFLSSLERTQWLHYLSQLLAVSSEVVGVVHEAALPVLVHCSDGWDRTTQVVALAELMLDPFYRTFEVLVQLPASLSCITQTVLVIIDVWKRYHFWPKSNFSDFGQKPWTIVHGFFFGSR